MKAIDWLVLLLAAAAWTGCDRGEPGEVPGTGEPADVVVSRPVAGAVSAAFAATVEAAERAELATRISGFVERVPVDVGSRVGRGDVLVVLDDGDVEARIEGAEAALRQATKAFRRVEALERDGAATAQELDDARAGLEMAEASLSEARAQRAYTVLRSPFAGVITVRSVDPGDLASPGRPVLALVGGGPLEVVADLPGEYGSRVATGDTVRILDPASGARLEARVVRLSPAVEESSRRFRLEAVLGPGAEAAELRPGRYVRLEVAEPGRVTWWIPADAVVRRGQLAGAFLVEGDTLRLRWIRLGQRRPGAVEALAGLTGDAAVVRRPAAGLVDGQPVGSVRVEEFGPESGPEPILGNGIDPAAYREDPGP